jgi:hypothetical protein
MEKLQLTERNYLGYGSKPNSLKYHSNELEKNMISTNNNKI